MMLPEQSADALGIDVPALLALEEGHRRVSPTALDILAGLYRYTGTQALRRLPAQHLDHAGVVRDQEPGHAERLAACVDSASGIRWQSTVLLPRPLQTPAYARAVGEVAVTRPGAPRETTGSAVYLVDERVIQRGSDDAGLMTEQLEHLLRLLDSGTDVRVLPGSCPVPQPAGHLVELHLPGGAVWARPGPDRVDYCSTHGFAEAITNSLSGTEPGFSYEALSRAAAAHRALAPSPRRTPSLSGNPSTPADRPVPSSARRAP